MFSGMGRAAGQQRRTAGGPRRACWSAIVVYALAFLLTRALSRYRELAADRAGAFLTGAAVGARLGADEDQRRDGPDPEPRPARGGAVQRLLLRPRRRAGLQPLVAVLHPPAAGDAGSTQLAKISATLARPREPCGLLGRLLGRSTPPEPTLDQLFALTDAALTLEAAHGAAPDRSRVGRPTGPPRAGRRATVTDEAEALLDADGGPAVERTVDRSATPGCWFATSPADTSGLVTDLHAVNSTS